MKQKTVAKQFTVVFDQVPQYVVDDLCGYGAVIGYKFGVNPCKVANTTFLKKEKTAKKKTVSKTTAKTAKAKK